MCQNKRTFCAIIFMSILLISNLAYADAGVPMIFVTFPLILFALVPIVLIEGYILYHRLNLTLKKSLLVATASNLTSTLIGIPLTWLLLVIVQMVAGGSYSYGIETFWGKFISVTLQAPWLLPYEGSLGWMIPIATIVLLMFFFFASWWIEYGISKLFLKKQYTSKAINRAINRAVLIGNIVSYLCLALYTQLYFVILYFTHRGH